MASDSFATVEISVVGNALPVLNALTLLTTILDRYDHTYTEDEQAILDLAVDLLSLTCSSTVVRGTTISPQGEG